MNYDELRSLTLEVVAEYTKVSRYEDQSSLQFGQIVHEATELAKAKNLSFGQKDRDTVFQITSELIHEGILGLGPPYFDANVLPFLHVTRYGRAVLDSETPQPHDPTGYLGELRLNVPNVDDIIVTYVAEALQTLRQNNLLSSAVMTGVAAERAFDLLLEAVTNAVTGPGQKEKFEKLQNDKRTKTKFDEVKKVINQHRKRLPHELEENLDGDLDGIFNLLRTTRNDFGHPTGKTPRQVQVFVNLQLFISYCKCVYGLIDFLKKNQI